MTALFIISFSFNVFVTFVFLRIFKRKRNVVNLIIINLGIANALHECPSSLWVIIASFMRKWVLGRIMCILDSFWVCWCAITVITLLAFLGYERYQMLKEFRTTEKQVSARSVLGVSGCWLYGLFWSIMPVIGWSDYGIEGIGISCSVQWHSRTLSGISYITCLFMAAYVIPIVVICFAYYKMWKATKHSQLKVTPVNKGIGMAKKSDRAHRQVAIMGFLMTISFLVTWTPYAIVSFLSFVDPVGPTPLTATVPCIIAKSSVIWFPLISALKHREFQIECRRFFPRLFPAAGKDHIRPVSIIISEIGKNCAD